MRSKLESAARFYQEARSYVESAGLAAEVAWQRATEFSEFTESDLLREHAWVTLCSGFRESVVRDVFDHVSLCFCDWESAEAVVLAGVVCCVTAEPLFANRLKLRGIFAASQHIHRFGFDKFKQFVLMDPIGQLQALPYIGPTTSWHLAKNLGLDVSKPDRHLVRISQRLGFSTASDLCRQLASITGDKAKVVDLIVWRYVADNPEVLSSV